MSASSLVLDVQDLSKGFALGGQQIQVLQQLNLQLSQGERVAILGPSGSGKSTLLGLLAGLESPDSGDIVLQGQSLSALNQEALTRYRARHLGIVFQQFHLMRHLTALENVLLPLEITGAAAASSRQVGLSHRMHHFPHQLSGGECQRVAMARALSTEPPLLLADEPSGNLDVETGEQVMTLLFDVLKQHQSSLILVTHNPEQATRCDRRLSLQHGQLVAL